MWEGFRLGQVIAVKSLVSSEGERWHYPWPFPVLCLVVALCYKGYNKAYRSKAYISPSYKDIAMYMFKS